MLAVGLVQTQVLQLKLCLQSVASQFMATLDGKGKIWKYDMKTRDFQDEQIQPPSVMDRYII